MPAISKSEFVRLTVGFVSKRMLDLMSGGPLPLEYRWYAFRKFPDDDTAHPVAGGINYAHIVRPS